MLSSLSRRAQRVSSPGHARIAELATSMKLDGADVIDLSAGRPAESTPHYICEAAAAALISGGTHQTLTQGSPEFRRACAQKLARDNAIIADPDRSIVATLGGKQGLLLALIASLNHGDEVIIEDPCFMSYDPAIRFAGGQPIRVPLLKDNGYHWSEAALESAVTRHTRAIVVSSPHNPTGRVHTEEDMTLLANVAQAHDLLVIVDETYEQLVWNGQHRSLANWPGMQDRTITLMSLNKAFSMGGWRIGFNHGPEPLVKAMINVQQHLVSSSSSFAQAGATVAMSDLPPRELKDLWTDWENRIQFAVGEINTMSCASCEIPDAGFYAWIDIRHSGISSKEMAHRLLQDQHVGLVPGSAFGQQGEGFLRMTCVKSWRDIRAGVKRIRKVLG